ncbi:GerW family sporulation protein [Dialister pneumosintes]|uniref:Sporulation protein n=1 Tax=Dialister pneumosintes TaxID=39950 RepID=A0ABX9MER0_9FIRM|nr:spore germination protein GerW family protein [Dialister pneumosintes]RID94783.1 sporulation protein [Dialister pneumosintes]
MNDAVRSKIFEEFKDMITTESVVGEPIYLGDATIVPFVDISFGFGTGQSKDCHEGGAGGGKVTPTAVLIMKGERIELFSIKNATANNTIDKMLNLMPEIISHFRKGKKDKTLLEEQVKTDADIDIKE